LTDNIIDGRVVPAPDVVRYDGDDPYLVVAADKGTATLSDTANQISYQRRFWLKDAFASGGEHGYDHKKMGITARGAWECVKLHFLQDGKDIQTTPFSVIGIGDMSGDVFGNGMLLSRFIKLNGAFNHIHIFVDPDPDPETSWKERERLFNATGSTWMDYSPERISRGGGVFERNAKSIPLSDEMRRLLDVSETSASGEELIRMLLKAKVDLLWNGGIGTYVKASSETDSQVADAANDAVRINANQLRVKVIGEGGNLGLTQQARLEAASQGIKLNTDAIDNSGGVDTSDHEVNLKILLDALISEGQIPSMEARNQLLEELTDDIAELVLKDNVSQGQIISMDNLRTRKDITPVLDLIDYLIDQKRISPNPDNLSTKEQMTACFTGGRGILRPDLAILLSYTKMHFSNAIIRSFKLTEPLLDDIYYGYFPPSFRSRFDITRFEHPLKKEIIGTVLTNRTINQAGITLLPNILSIVDTNPVDIIVGYTVIDQLFQLDDLRTRVMAELKVSNINAAYTLLTNIERFIRAMLLWSLTYFDSDVLHFSMIDDYRKKVIEYRDIFEASMDPEEKQAIQKTYEGMLVYGVSTELARDLARGEFMRKSLEVIVLSQKLNIPIAEAITLVQGVDSMFHFPTLNSQILKTEVASAWGKKHKGMLIRQLILFKQQVAATVLEQFAAVDDFDEKLQRFMDSHKPGFKQYQVDFNRLMAADTKDLSGFTILLDRVTLLLS
jgi:glutamate dehydrogenase